MICAGCGASAAGETCVSCGGSPLLDGRYELVDRLGRGAVGTTWRAVRRADGRAVAIKELRLERLDSPKSMALFERECEVLSQLRHSGIPAFVESFRAGERRGQGFYLVQELVEGQSLAQELREKRHTEAEVLAVLLDVLDVLTYLASLSPPVVHRDLKPENLVRRAGDGRVVLVDFGAVHAAVRDGAGSTLAGTPGYMAPEQLKGLAGPATDLYALGCVAVAMLSRRAPLELLDERFELRWEKVVTASDGLRAALRRMLEPDPRRRPRSAAALAQELRAPRRASSSSRVASIGLAAMVAAALAGIGAASLSGGQQEPPRPEVVPAAVAPKLDGTGILKASECARSGGCARIRDGLLGRKFEEICAEFLKDPAATKGRAFDLELDGLTARCESNVVVGDRCSARCTVMRDFDLTGQALLLRAERVAQFLRDRYGTEQGQSFYRQTSWRWSDGNDASMTLSSGEGTATGRPEGMIMLVAGAKLARAAVSAKFD